MAKHSNLNNGIPVSLSLKPTLEAEDIRPKMARNQKRLLTISVLAVIIAAFTSVVAKVLVHLIDFITNIAFQGEFSFVHGAPTTETFGLFTIAIPAIGGVIIGFMALYGSKAIRGHGIPEAMEQILTNKSKIRPAITYLKPLSSAISIGTGGPFGAEGPIIATGGALGSTIGQLVKITHNERKILLAAGATAGMAAIFGSPIAAIFLAIELLLFEFSPRSIIPIALACITGAAGHHLLFEAGPVFPMETFVETPSNTAIAAYSVIGIAIGVLSIVVTKIVYFIEDGFEKLPVHWMWWPAIGGLVVGIVGYFAPRTLGVGYYNITELLSGNMPLQIVISLCLMKFISWAVALGSGTSGGTLAPLLIIGGAMGVLLGSAVMYIYPESGVVIPLAALVGMSAMFAGASRALLTSIIFALETTGQSNALLPLLAACTGSYFVSFFLMKSTIMTEKINRRGVKTPDSYEPDILEKITVEQVFSEKSMVVTDDKSIEEVRRLVEKSRQQSNYLMLVSQENKYSGIVSSTDLFNNKHNASEPVRKLRKGRLVSVGTDYSLRTAIEVMAKEGLDALPVVSYDNKNKIMGILTYKDIIASYKLTMEEHEKQVPNISLKRKGLKMMLRGQRLVTMRKKKR